MRLHPKIVGVTYWIIRKVFGPLVRAVWIRRVEGLHHIPRHGAVIVAFNHQSYFDFLCFIAVSPRNIHFLSAEKFFSHLVWAPLMHLTGQIKVERHAKDKRVVHDAVAEHLEAGKVIGIFPEGTRCPDPEHMKEAFSGVARYAIRGKVPVVPVGLKGTFEVMSRHDHKPRFKKVVEIIVGKPISFEEYHHSKMNRKALKVLTDHVMFSIAALAGKTYRHAGVHDIR